MKNKFFKIKNRFVGDKKKVFIVAEIGINHDGNLKKCLKMINQAAKAGADSVKIQTNEVKEIKMRPGIDKHDYEVKIRALSKFISGGNKVKVSMRFRGREMEHQDLGLKLLKKLTEQVSEYAKIEAPPKSEGKQIMMVLVPQTNK